MPCATTGMGLVAVSRFLKNPIQIGFAEIKIRRLKSYPRARLCIWVGGYMRGRGKKEGKVAKAKKRQARLAGRVRPGRRCEKLRCGSP